MRLSNVILPTLAGSNGPNNVAIPTYPREAIEPGILHFGVGNFQAAFTAAYMDDLFRQEDDFEEHKKWGIVGASVPPHGAKKRSLLEPQDWLCTLVERDAKSSRASILGSMIDMLPIEIEPIMDSLMDPRTKIVSMTVTEGGYFLHDGKFDPNHPEMQADIKSPDEPKTVFGLLVKALKMRGEQGMGTFSVMSCDNIPHNGDVVKSVLVGLAEQTDKDLAKWIGDNVAFPNSMVDRITPATTDLQRAFVKENYGYDDASPVFCEPFRQWVLEDKFCNNERPNLDILDNVKFTTDVGPYEFMKLRILNGGHASLCYPSALLDLDFVHEAMEHPVISEFLNTLQKSEIIPTVPKIPDDDIDFEDYWKIVAERFSNPTLCDTIPRNCFDGPSRQPKFTIPVARDNLKAGRSVDGIAIVSAFWCRYCMGVTESGKEIEPNDPQWDKLNTLACEAKKEPACWLLELPDVYGGLGKDPIFQESFERALNCVMDDGVEATMKKYNEGSFRGTPEDSPELVSQ